MLGARARNALFALVLCGCAPAVRAQATACSDARWGGYDRNPRCAALAQRTILGTDRSCTRDSDCALVHPGASCREQAVSAAHLSSYASEMPACTNPASGPCSTARAACVAGCCAVMR